MDRKKKGWVARERERDRDIYIYSHPEVDRILVIFNPDFPKNKRNRWNREEKHKFFNFHVLVKLDTAGKFEKATKFQKTRKNRWNEYQKSR